jgi:hypothetical protein
MNISPPGTNITPPIDDGISFVLVGLVSSASTKGRVDKSSLIAALAFLKLSILEPSKELSFDLFSSLSSMLSFSSNSIPNLLRCSACSSTKESHISSFLIDALIAKALDCILSASLLFSVGVVLSSIILLVARIFLSASFLILYIRVSQ